MPGGRQKLKPCTVEEAENFDQQEAAKAAERQQQRVLKQKRDAEAAQKRQVQEDEYTARRCQLQQEAEAYAQSPEGQRKAKKAAQRSESYHADKKRRAQTDALEKNFKLEAVGGNDPSNQAHPQQVNRNVQAIQGYGHHQPSGFQSDYPVRTTQGYGYQQLSDSQSDYAVQTSQGYGNQQPPGFQSNFPIQTNQGYRSQQPPPPAHPSNDPTRGLTSYQPPIPSPPTFYSPPPAQSSNDPTRGLTSYQPALPSPPTFYSSTGQAPTAPAIPQPQQVPVDTHRSARMDVGHYVISDRHGRSASGSSDEDRSRKHHKPNERRH